jgi:hypothetical protein
MDEIKKNQWIDNMKREEAKNQLIKELRGDNTLNNEN